MSENRTQKITTMLTPTEKKFFEKFAKKQGISLSEFMRLSMHRNIHLEIAFQDAVKQLAKDWLPMSEKES